MKPNTSGENLEAGPKKEVKLTPAKDIAKSITANPIISPPIIGRIDVFCFSLITIAFLILFPFY
jgi:hypothetical protein